MRPEDQKKRVVDVVDVVRHGDRITVPETVTLHQAIDVLVKRLEYEEEIVTIHEPVHAFVWDGAYALSKALEQMFGFTTMEKTPGFFRDNPPELIGVEVAPGKTVQVPWGRIKVPGVEGFIQTGYTTKEGRFIFQLSAEVKRKSERVVAEIADLTRQIVREHSIYRSQAIEIRFRDDDGDKIAMPEPRFIDLSRVNPEEIVFSEDLERAIETNVLTPLRHTEAVRAAGIPLKRGVLLAGPYGTGKTLCARVAAKVATQNGWTYIYLRDVRELAEAIPFAQQYAPAVVFAEDVDRVVSGQRSVELDAVLNTIDGIGTKDSDLMVVLTTNHLENVHQAMLRPGRLDVVINVHAPDAEAVERLARVYGRDLIAPDADLSAFGALMAGQIPAVIREAVERSKLEFIRRTGGGDRVQVVGDDLVAAAKTMDQQRRLLEPRPADTRSDREKAAAVLGDKLGEAFARLRRNDEATEPAPLNGAGQGRTLPGPQPTA